MYSLYRLLLQRSYWAMLLRGATWREGCMSLKRAHKDKRARKHLGRLLLLALTPILCVVYLIWLIGTRAIVFLPLVVSVIWWINHRNKKKEVQHIAPQPEPVDRVLSTEESASVRTFLADLTLYYGILADRAGSENFLKTKVLPEGMEVTSRRILLDLLREKDLWDRMAPQDRDAMLQADGHWEWELIRTVSLSLEPLRLLRWLLEIDVYLPLVGQQLTNDFALAQDIVHHPEKLQGDKLRDLATIRIGRDAAHVFYGRCLAEALARGYFTTNDEKLFAWAKEISTKLEGKQHEDQVLGHQIVADAPEEIVLWAVSVSERRRNFLNWVMAVLDKEELPEMFPAAIPAMRPVETESTP